MKKIRCAIVVLLLALLVIPALAQEFRIVHIDVDQGDATLFIAPEGNAMLVDTGNEGKGKKRVQPALEKYGVETIDALVTTHYDADHYSGIDELDVEVIQFYDRGEKAGHDKEGTPRFDQYLAAGGDTAVRLVAGDSFMLGDDVSVTCIASCGAVAAESPDAFDMDENAESVVLIVEFKGFTYFIGGDVFKNVEEKIEDVDAAVDLDVYHCSHHGSDTSSSPALLEEMLPTVVVISNGNHGGYKHPNKDTMATFAALSPSPTVFQTNRCNKGDPCQNTDDRFIADKNPFGPGGEILLTVADDGASYRVDFEDHRVNFFETKHPETIGGGDPGSPSPGLIQIVSMIPAPDGPDTENESVTLSNTGGQEVSLSGWRLCDRSEKCWRLDAVGSIPAGAKVVVLRNGRPMTLNDNGDRIELLNADSGVVDSLEYPFATQEQVILPAD